MIDIDFDFRTDTPDGADPDAYSPTLRSYHQRLWSKPLPNGVVFDLQLTAQNYIVHQSKLGEFAVSSDSVIPSFKKEKRLQAVFQEIPATDIEAFRTLGYTIGGMMIFPSNRVDGKATINGSRGFHPLIKDRFDLTLECIKRFYINEPSPLSEVLGRYKTFFSLFGNFKNYTQFFLLQDWVIEDSQSIDFALPFDGFNSLPLPKTVEEYLIYKNKSSLQIALRNQRIFRESIST
jgi:hypothetical protein